MGKTAQKHLAADNRGFTLIEAMIAMAIFSIGFLAIMTMQVNALNYSTDSRQDTVAQELSSGKLGYLQGLPFYTDNNFNACPSQLVDNYHKPWYTDQTTDPRYIISWQVMNDPLATIPDPNNPNRYITGSKLITVKVAAADNPGKTLAWIQGVKIWQSNTSGTR